jgi:hypothetical protein
MKEGLDSDRFVRLFPEFESILVFSVNQIWTVMPKAGDPPPQAGLGCASSGMIHFPAWTSFSYTATIHGSIRPQ